MRGRRVASAALLGLSACAGLPEPAIVAPDYFTIVVEKDGVRVDPEPAYLSANERCAETLQHAVFFRAEDVGADAREYYFRCE